MSGLVPWLVVAVVVELEVDRDRVSLSEVLDARRIAVRAGFLFYCTTALIQQFS